MQGKMKAARLYGFEKTHGSQDLVRVDDVPIPDVEAGEVLIRVLRAGLNHGDLHIREDALAYAEDAKAPYLPMTLCYSEPRNWAKFFAADEELLLASPLDRLIDYGEHNDACHV